MLTGERHGRDYVSSAEASRIDLILAGLCQGKHGKRVVPLGIYAKPGRNLERWKQEGFVNSFFSGNKGRGGGGVG